jgi:hypothetical protein
VEPKVVIRKAMLLTLLTSSCVMDHGFGGIRRVLFSIGSRAKSVLMLFSSSELHANFEPVSEPESW